MLDGIEMNPVLKEAVSKITQGLYIMAAYVVVLAVLSIVIGRKYGGSNRRQQKRTANLVWAIGLVLFALIAIPSIYM